MEFVWRNYVLVINGNYWVKTTNSIELLSQLLMVFILCLFILFETFTLGNNYCLGSLWNFEISNFGN